jgi:hypothetical protein
MTSLRAPTGTGRQKCKVTRKTEGNEKEREREDLRSKDGAQTKKNR